MMTPTQEDPLKNFRANSRRSRLLAPLILWLAASAAACLAIGSLVGPEYEASALLQVDPIEQSLFSTFERTDPLRESRFIRDQIALLSSQWILNNAVTKPMVSELPAIRESGAPVDLMKSRLTVVNVPDTTLIRVSYVSTSPSEAQNIVKAIVDDYLKFIALQSGRSGVKLRSNLEKFAREFEAGREEHRRELQHVMAAIKKPGVVPVDQDSPTSFTSLTKELHRTAAERLIQVDIEIAGGSPKQEELKKTRAYLRTLLLMPVTDSEHANVDSLTKEIEFESRGLEAIRRKLLELDFVSQGEARISEVADVVLPGLPIRDRRLPLMALSSFGILCLVLAIRRIGLYPARLAAVDS